MYILFGHNIYDIYVLDFIWIISLITKNKDIPRKHGETKKKDTAFKIINSCLCVILWICSFTILTLLCLKKLKKETFLSDHKVISMYIVWHISLKLSAFKLIINFLNKMKWTCSLFYSFKFYNSAIHCNDFPPSKN